MARLIRDERTDCALYTFYRDEEVGVCKATCGEVRCNGDTTYCSEMDTVNEMEMMVEFEDRLTNGDRRF